MEDQLFDIFFIQSQLRQARVVVEVILNLQQASGVRALPLVNHRAQMLSGKTPEMPAVHRADRQLAQTLQAAGVVVEVGVVGVFDQWPVVDDVAAEQGLGRRFVQADAAR